MMCYYLNVHFQGQRVKLHSYFHKQTNKQINNKLLLRSRLHTAIACFRILPWCIWL